LGGDPPDRQAGPARELGRDQARDGCLVHRDPGRHRAEVGHVGRRCGAAHGPIVAPVAVPRQAGFGESGPGKDSRTGPGTGPVAVRTVSGVSPRLVGALLCALACVGVGSSISITAAMRDYPVHGGQALRYLATGLILLLVLRIRSVPWLRPTGRDLLRLLALAGSGMVGFNVVLIEATRYASPSLIGAMLGC